LDWFLPHAAIHDWHHEYHQECFSTEIAIWDNICGTNKVYMARAHGERECHIVGVDDKKAGRSNGQHACSIADSEAEHNFATAEESLSPLPAAESPTSDPGDEREAFLSFSGAPPALHHRKPEG
jgi:hypothetical protein